MDGWKEGRLFLKLKNYQFGVCHSLSSDTQVRFPFMENVKNHTTVINYLKVRCATHLNDFGWLTDTQ